MMKILSSQIGEYLESGYRIVAQTVEEAQEVLKLAREQGFAPYATLAPSELRCIVPCAFRESSFSTGRTIRICAFDTFDRYCVKLANAASDFLY